MKVCYSKFRRSLVSLVMAVIMMLTVFVGAPIAVNTKADDPAPDVDQAEAVVLDKTVKVNDDNTYTLNIESYATGEVVYKPEERELPADVVLVIDRSSSMGEDFPGSSSRMAALRSSAKAFVDDMTKRFNAEKSDHRISIVSFGRTANSVRTWTYLNTSNTTDIKNSIDNIGAESSYTYPDTGLDMAYDMFQPYNRTTNPNGDNYDGPNKDKRQKAVILFTDGVPCSSGDNYFDITYANKAIVSANKIKKQDIKVYGIGIFENAKSNVMYGSLDYFKSLGLNTTTLDVYGADISSYCTSGAVGQKWMVTDHFNVDNAVAGNRMMNIISSNVTSDETTVGLSKNDPIERKGNRWYKTTTFYGFTITKEIKREEQSYYFTAATASELTEQFAVISELIEYGGTIVELNEETQIRDIITKYFTLPKNATVNDIILKVAKCKGVDADGNYLFDDPILTKDTEAFKGVQAIITDHFEESDRRNITVTGFDFTDNYVAYDPVAKEARGHKLIITFDIEAIEGFSGGNNIPTNDPASGIYPPGKNAPLKPYPQPHVDIAIKDPECIIKQDNFVIYQGNSINADDVIDVVTEGDRPILDDFVERTIEVKVDGKYVLLENDLFTPDESIFYPDHTIRVTISPTSEKEPGSEGTEAKPVSVENTSDFTIYVIQPTVDVKMQDVKRFYGALYELGEGAEPDNNISVTWTEKKKISGKTYTAKTENDVSDGFKAPFKKSDIHLDFTSEGFKGKITKKDITVNAEAYFNDDVFNGHGKVSEYSEQTAVNYSTKCDYGCSDRTDGTYKVHSQTTDLTLKNNGGNSNVNYVYTIKKDGMVYTTVSVKGNGSITLKELPAGTYEVIANDTWAWRYTTTFKDNKNSAVLNSDNTSGTITAILTAKTTPAPRGDVSETRTNTRSKVG